MTTNCEAEYEMLKDVDAAIWSHFFPEDEGNEWKMPDNTHGMKLWLAGDIEAVLIASPKLTVVIDKMDEIVQEVTNGKRLADVCDILKIRKGVSIRKNFKKYLNKVDRGFELSSALGYGFSNADIKKLAKIHKAGDTRIREKIEDLLEDCNFHTECADFAAGRYDSYVA